MFYTMKLLFEIKLFQYPHPLGSTSIEIGSTVGMLLPNESRLIPIQLSDATQENTT